MNLASTHTPRTSAPKVDRPVEWPMEGCTPCSSEHAAWASYYESRYAQAAGDANKLGWARQCPHPSLVEWLNDHASSTLRPGACVAVVGCGLGDDVAELAGRGYDAFGFDCAPSAIAWAQRRHSEIAGRFLTADLFDPPSTVLRRADLVVDVGTLASVPPTMRQAAVQGLAALARGRAAIVVVCEARDLIEPVAGPPFKFCPDELRSLFADRTWNVCDEAGGLCASRCAAGEATLRGVFKRG